MLFIVAVKIKHQGKYCYMAGIIAAKQDLSQIL